MALQKAEKISIVAAVIVIIAIVVWFVWFWYSMEAQRKEVEVLLKEKEISPKELPVEELSPEDFFEKMWEKSETQGEELPSPAEFFQGPEG